MRKALLLASLLLLSSCNEEDFEIITLPDDQAPFSTPTPVPTSTVVPVATKTPKPTATVDIAPLPPGGWPKCPKFDNHRGGFIVLPGSNFPSVKVILPTTFTMLDPERNVFVSLEGPSKLVDLNFDGLFNPDPILLRPHYSIRKGCKEVAEFLGTNRPSVIIFDKQNMCTVQLQKGKTICDRND